MIRLNLNSAKSGVLYHFARTVDVIYSILRNGLQTSSICESHMRHVDPNDPKMKSKVSKKFAESPEMAFVSLTRNPSIMPRQGKDTGSWRYGVIFSADKLSNVAKLIPYQYNTSNHYFSITVNPLKGDPGGYIYSTDTSPEAIEVRSTGKEDDTPLDQFLDVFYQMVRTVLSSRTPRGSPSWTKPMKSLLSGKKHILKQPRRKALRKPSSV